MRPGAKTSEFGTAVGTALAVLSFAALDEREGVRIAAVVAAATVAIAYAALRTYVKVKRSPVLQDGDF